MTMLIAGLMPSSVSAGTLAPTALPATTHYTLADIYNRLITGVTAGTHRVSPFFAPASQVNLTQVYNAIPSYAPNYLYKNQWNPSLSAGGYPGGSQALGGVDDYNNGGASSTNRYTNPLGWTQCNSSAYNATTNPGGNYCNTGAAGADAKDNATGLIWSLPCKNTRCSTFTETSPSTYQWTATSTASNNGGLSATSTCSQGDHGQSGWSLPHQKQLMQAYINGSYGYLEPTGSNRIYWSATTLSYSVDNAWDINLSTGNTNNTTKTTATSIRCVRPAP